MLSILPSLSGKGEGVEGIVKILDLGLALLGTDSPGEGELTAAGSAIGTADYIAPEQVSDAHSVDIRADIYSLGCTFYKLLSGLRPFQRAAVQDPGREAGGPLEGDATAGATAA